MSNLNGMLLINKEKGISSFGVVSKVRKILNIKKVGHSGTLDPEAEGLMQIMIGNGTKASKYLVEHNKTYIACAKFGIKTSTADMEGTILDKDNFTLKKENEDNYKKIFNSFLGKSKQIPPIYSAIKVDGKKMYEYARENEEEALEKIEIKERDIEIYSIKILEIDYEENEIEYEVSCSKGTYIRSLCEDIAKKMGTFSYMKSLKRIKINDYSIENAISIKDLELNKESIEGLKSYVTIENMFKDKETIKLNNRKLELFLNGVKLSTKNGDGIYRIYNEESFIGIGIVKNNLLKRDIIL